MGKIKKVLDFVLPENQKASKELQEERKKHCDSCHFRKPKTNSCGKFIIGQTVTYHGEVKKLCGCDLDALRSGINFHCSVGIW